MARFRVSFNARTGDMFFGKLNTKIHGATYDQEHATRVLGAQGFARTAEWIPDLTGTGYSTWVARTDA